MDRKSLYCVFYIILLTWTVPALCANLKMEEEHSKERQKRFAVAALPLYAGIAVSPWVWAALLAVYGLSAVLSAGVLKTNSDSHSCYNNRGWCRAKCFTHEKINWWSTPVCGDYYCCVPK